RSRTAASMPVPVSLTWMHRYASSECVVAQLWAGADDHGVSFLADVDQPDALLPFLTVVLDRLVDCDNELSSRQRHGRMRVAAERRAPIDAADRLRFGNIGYVENRHAGVYHRDIGSVTFGDDAVHVEMLAGKRRPVGRRFLAFLGARNPP